MALHTYYTGSEAAPPTPAQDMIPLKSPTRLQILNKQSSFQSLLVVPIVRNLTYDQDHSHMLLLNYGTLFPKISLSPVLALYQRHRYLL